jgi:hypothetical protein
MRISQAGLQSGLPTTRFSAPLSSRRESHLGLRRRLAPQITSHPAAYARIPLVDALRAAARGASGTTSRRIEEAAPSPAGNFSLGRSDSMTWSQPTDGHTHRPRSRSAAPWRG